MGGCCSSSNPDHHTSEVDSAYRGVGNLESLRAILHLSENTEDILIDSLKTPSWLSFEDQVELDKTLYLVDICLICMEEFNDLQHHPRILPCGHIICNECLIELARSTIFTTVKCPQDRQVFRVEKIRRTGTTLSDPRSSAEDIESKNSGISVHSGSSRVFHYPFRRNRWLPNDLPESSNSDFGSIETITLTEEPTSGNLQNSLSNQTDKHVSTFSHGSSSDTANQQSSFVSRISTIPRDGASFFEPLPDYPM